MAMLMSMASISAEQLDISAVAKWRGAEMAEVAHFARITLFRAACASR